MIFETSFPLLFLIFQWPSQPAEVGELPARTRGLWAVPGANPQRDCPLRCLIPRFSQTTSAIDWRKARARATTTPEIPRAQIRDAVRKRHHLTQRQRVHVDPADHIPVALEATFRAPPVPPFGLVARHAFHHGHPNRM